MRQLARFVGVTSIAVLFTAGLSACSMNPFTNEAPSRAESLSQQDDIIWSSGDQYVALADNNAGSENIHPASIPAQDLKTILASIHITDGFVLKKDKTPVFSVGEQQVLSSTLSQALVQAGSGQDVTFATTARYSSTFSEQQKSNSARVFISKNGRLNMIFGLLHSDYEDDAMNSTLLAGNRSSSAELDGTLSLGLHQNFHVDPHTGVKRTDWLVIDTIRLLMQAKSTVQNGNYINAEILQDVSKSKQETGNLKQDVSKMKEIIFELTDEVERLKREVELLKSTR